MSRVLSESLGWLRRQALSYLAILGLLLAGGWLLGEFRRAQALEVQAGTQAAELQQQRAAVARAEADAALADRLLAARIAVLRQARDAARQALAAKEAEREAHRVRYWPWAGLHGAAVLLQSRLLDEQAAALRQALRLAQEQLDAAASLQGAVAGVQGLQAKARARRAEADRLRAQWHRLSAAHPLQQRLAWSPVAKELDDLKAQVERLQDEAVAAERGMAAVARSRELAGWLQRRAALEAAQAALRQAEVDHAATLQSLQRNAWQRLGDAGGRFLGDYRRHVVLALLLLLGAMASRLLVKLLLFYGIAPWAARRPPLQLLPEATAKAGPLGGRSSGRISAESIALQLRAGDELLVRPECLQGSSGRSRKRTAWLFDWRLPFTSLLAGLYLLTRIRTQEPETLVLSAAGDPLAEVCALELPAGAALVCHPRALAGVLRPREGGVRITRHWRLGQLQAWFTLQLRFLVFHGPCTLVLQGRRGVRMEPAAGGRVVHQAGTLAFDAAVPYANARTETFVPYWLGKEDLFTDCFGAAHGACFVEERPQQRRGNALVGRGLEGLADGVLKVFGI